MNSELPCTTLTELTSYQFPQQIIHVVEQLTKFLIQASVFHQRNSY